MVDLTTLEGADTPGRVRALCAQARHPDPTDRDDGPDGGGGSAGTAARSSRDHGRNHMARIVAGSPPMAQRQSEKITRCDRIGVPVTRLSGVHRCRGGGTTSHDRRPWARVPEVRDRPDGREDS